MRGSVLVARAGLEQEGEAVEGTDTEVETVADSEISAVLEIDSSCSGEIVMDEVIVEEEDERSLKGNDFSSKTTCLEI
jgi:hypothetical protein